MKTKKELLQNSQDLTKCVAQWHGMQWTHSLAIAEQFGKQHKDVLKKIEKTIEQLKRLAQNCADVHETSDTNDSDRLTENSADVNKFKYIVSAYKDDYGREQKYYKMNKELFMLIINGFTGSEAFKVKVEFVLRFSELDEEVANKKVEYAGSKGGYKGQFNRVKEENEELKNKVAKLEYLNVKLSEENRKADTKVDIIFNKLVDIVEEISKID